MCLVEAMQAQSGHTIAVVVYTIIIVAMREMGDEVEAETRLQATGQHKSRPWTLVARYR